MYVFLFCNDFKKILERWVHCNYIFQLIDTYFEKMYFYHSMKTVAPIPVRFHASQ